MTPRHYAGLPTGRRDDDIRHFIYATLSPPLTPATDAADIRRI